MTAMAGLSFVYVLLPVMLAVFLLSPPDWRPAALLLLSVAYYLLAQPGYLLFMLSCVAMDWAALIVMERFDDFPKIRAGCLIFSVCKNLAGIFWFWGMIGAGRVIESPLGIQVFALSGLWCVLQTYRREAPYVRGPVHLALYCTFFPRLYAGPMMPYKDFELRLEGLNPSLSEVEDGFFLYVQGAVKTGVLGAGLMTLHGSVVAISEAEASVLGGWCAVLFLALGVYYQLWGLAVMARGIGKMTGLYIPQNFYYPYQSRSIDDFFQRFNISVGRFLQDIYPRLKTEGKAADIVRILLIGVASGLWFGAEIGYIAWGIYIALFIILEKYVYPRMLERIPTLFRRVYALTVVLVGFSLFGAETLGQAAGTAGRLLGIGALPLFSQRLGYLIASNWLLLAVSLIFATSGVSLLLGLFRKHLPRAAQFASGVAGVLMLVLLTAFSL